MLGASGRHVGPGWPPGAPQIALGGGPGAARRPNKFMWRLLGASWGGKSIDFSFRRPGALRCDMLVRPLRAHGANQGKGKNNYSKTNGT